MNCRPWYKENLPSECFMKPKNRLTVPRSLNSQRWIFVRKGLDDFRKGCPPCDDLIIQGPQKHFLPEIYHRAPRPVLQKRQNKLPKEAALFSKLSLAQQARKAFLEDTEAQLSPHPLAVNLNLEDMPVELLLKVLEVLDPDRKLEDTWTYSQGIKKRTKEPIKLLKKRSTQVYLGLPKKTPVSHPSRLLYEEKPSEVDLLHEEGPFPYENVRKEVSDFCNWAASIGSSNIDEEFILKQFEIDYQSKPRCDVLHTMRLSQVPLELKKSVGLNTLQEPECFQKLDHERKHQKLQNPYKPKWVKMRYGAWYLNTKLWKKQRADEPLVDPKVSRKAQEENFKKELQEQELLADLQGTVAFKDFVLSRGYNMPSFLEKMYIGKKCNCECKAPIKYLSIEEFGKMIRHILFTL
ncbi:LOW QUALITY PROTEIN: protein FAM47E [Rhinolophus ferrumequinum]|uniref:LOW QUALITY PROTEIN: protein FAM47E n=1 Tax=Rhinolophus ferrumequinum TaxID=59479 RepID=UPI00140F9C68|nr:LOW QUALITY PROTEIN: protein FAM47E [Rhinolophus ferrumequinum]